MLIFAKCFKWVLLQKKRKKKYFATDIYAVSDRSIQIRIRSPYIRLTHPDRSMTDFFVLFQWAYPVTENGLFFRWFYAPRWFWLVWGTISVLLGIVIYLQSFCNANSFCKRSFYFFMFSFSYFFLYFKTFFFFHIFPVLSDFFFHS